MLLKQCAEHVGLIDQPEWATFYSTEDGRIDCGCQIAFRPYNLAVTALLVIVKHDPGDDLQVKIPGETCQ